MGLLDSLFSAGTSLIGDFMAQQGQEQTNANQMAMMQQNQAWQEHMSDTAMQRRVTDLQAAGLNPMLAVSSQGATTGSVSQPTLGNPGASFAQLGQQATSALQLQGLQAQVRDTNASAQLKESQTPGNFIPYKPDGSPDFDHMSGGALGNAALKINDAQVRQLDHLWEQIQADIRNKDSQTTSNYVASSVGSLDFQGKQAMLQALIQKAQADANISTETAGQMAPESKIMSGPLGVWIAGLRMALRGIGIGH